MLKRFSPCNPSGLVTYPCQHYSYLLLLPCPSLKSQADLHIQVASRNNSMSVLSLFPTQHLFHLSITCFPSDSKAPFPPPHLGTQAGNPGISRDPSSVLKQMAQNHCQAFLSLLSPLSCFHLSWVIHHQPFLWSLQVSKKLLWSS